MNQMTYVKRFLAHRTGLNWLLTNWGSIDDLNNFVLKSDLFTLRRSEVRCQLELKYADGEIPSVNLSITARTQPLQFSFFMYAIGKDNKKCLIVSEDVISLNADDNIVHLRYTIDHDYQLSTYEENDALTVCCELEERCEDDNDNEVNEMEGCYQDHVEEGGGERLMDGWEEMSVVEEVVHQDANRPYQEKLVLADYGKLYKREDLCDLVITVESKTVMCHTFVLATISSYFARLIRLSRVCYYNLRQINIGSESWLTPALLESFLEYAYGIQSLFELRGHVYELLRFAIKFQVSKLREHCECYLQENMNNYNVIRTLRLAHECSCDELKTRAMVYARSCIKELRYFGDLEGLRDYPILYAEVVRDEEIFV